MQYELGTFDQGNYIAEHEVVRHYVVRGSSCEVSLRIRVRAALKHSSVRLLDASRNFASLA